jgi:hypothetical protein
MSFYRKEAFLKMFHAKAQRRCRDRKENISWQIRFADNTLMKRKLNHSRADCPGNGFAFKSPGASIHAFFLL